MNLAAAGNVYNAQQQLRQRAQQLQIGQMQLDQEKRQIQAAALSLPGIEAGLSGMKPAAKYAMIIVVARIGTHLLTWTLISP